jgi:selenium-binding protein 1
MKAPPEKLAYVAAFDPACKKPDAIAVVDVDPRSKGYSQIVGTVEMSSVGDELHHFGWNACSSCLCPNAPHPHMERRYLVVPGLRSFAHPHPRHLKPDPRSPTIIKVVNPRRSPKRQATRAPTDPLRPGRIYVSALGNP